MAGAAVDASKLKYGQIFIIRKDGRESGMCGSVSRHAESFITLHFCFNTGKGFPLMQQSCVIGRSESADIRVSSAVVSSVHCKININEQTGEAVLHNLGNDTKVNDIGLPQNDDLKLNHKDVIEIGGRRLRFEYLPPDFKPLYWKTSKVYHPEM